MSKVTLEDALKSIAFYDGYRDAFNPCDNPVGKNYQIDKYLSLDELFKIWAKISKEAERPTEVSVNLANCRLFKSVFREASKLIEKAPEFNTIEAIVMITAATIDKRSDFNILQMH